jgi:DNA-binding transcriptional LysR family regulator
MSGANGSRWATKLASLDANLLIALDALLQENSVTRAATQLGVTQSAMSQTLARLRHQFDDPILVKVGRQMEPSPFGLRIKARLRVAVEELEAIVGDRPTFDAATASDRFVLATVDYLAALLFPALARAVSAGAPRVDLAVRALDTASVTPELQAGHVHLYVGVVAETERALEVERLFTDRLRVLVRAGHPLAAGALDIAGYAGAAHVLVSPRRERSSIIGRALEEAGHARRVAIEVPYFSLLPGLLLESDLIATVPERIAQTFADQHPLEILEPPVSLPGIEICLAWHPTYAADPAQVWLREVVRSVCREI